MSIITAAVLRQRMVLAAIGEVLDMARLYIMGATAQQAAATKAATSPNITALVVDPLGGSRQTWIYDLFRGSRVLNSKSYHVASRKYVQGAQKMSFKQKMEQAAKAKQSTIVLALDFPYQSKENRANLLAKAQDILAAVSQYICAVKINHHLTLPLGTFGGVQKIIAQAHKAGLLTIMDGKVNDIGATNQTIAEYYFEAGFDALIVNPFIGWEEGLKPLFETAAKQQPPRGIILLAYMSHKGAAEGYGQTILNAQTGAQTKQYLSFAQKALSLNADGAVVGATVPEKIREIHQILGDKVPIYSPGVGAQGGGAQEALKAGARYLIVGREITQAQNPAEQAQKLAQIRPANNP